MAKDGHTIYETDGNRISATRVQEVDAYFEQNKLLRDNIDKTAAKRWAMPIAQIPFAVYKKLVEANPALRYGDAETVTKEWLKLLQTGALEQCRTVRRTLMPDSLTPDRGSIILPYKEETVNACETLQQQLPPGQGTL